MKRTAQIFLCYAHEDEAKVKELYNKLFSNGFKPWMDKIDLVGGEEWQFAIQQAILQSDFFIACVSSCWSEGKRRFFRREIKTALNVLPEMQTGDIYIIPLRLEECDVPESLMLFHWIDYFHDDGWERLAKSIQRGMERLGIAKPVRLRSYPLNELLEEDVIKMLKEKDFSDAFLNRSGKALKHQYEMKELQGEKFIIDHITELMWQQSGSNEVMNFEEADKYIQRLNENHFAGYGDWRMPTLEEAMSLIEPEESSSKLFIDPLFSRKQWGSWTADKKSDNVTWAVVFDFGYCANLDVNGQSYVRAVRNE